MTEPLWIECRNELPPYHEVVMARWSPHPREFPMTYERREGRPAIWRNKRGDEVLAAPTHWRYLASYELAEKEKW